MKELLAGSLVNANRLVSSKNQALFTRQRFQNVSVESVQKGLSNAIQIKMSFKEHVQIRFGVPKARLF